ncbi:MAG: hypothetical protein ACKOQM_01715 [Novosphingobium sp.]
MELTGFKKCFVIQRFDGAIYDKRYRETFAPAIERAGAKPIRADEVLGTKPIVDKIEEGLKQADVAFAEISEDNPNVFLELGIALTLRIPTVIVCDKSKRNSIPFDIAHRPITFYTTNAQSDYEKIATSVQSSIEAALIESESQKLKAPSSEVPTSQQIDEVKSRCLIALLDQNLRTPVGSSLWEVQKEVTSSGISERMVSLALMSLIDESMVEQGSDDDSGQPFHTYTLSTLGRNYILRSYSEIMKREMEQSANRVLTSSTRRSPFQDDLDDDIPF